MVQLYRTISKELPRVLTIYDADLAPAEVRLGACMGGMELNTMMVCHVR